MNRIVLGFLLVVAHLTAGEVEEFVKKSQQGIDSEAQDFLKSLYSEESSANKPNCKKCVAAPPVLQPEHQNLKVFMSFSVPIESWKDWSHALEKEGGVFVINGLPENSFRKFAQRIKELREAGVNSPIIINPEMFQQYRIQEVPAAVLGGEERFDKLTGNIQLREALQIFSGPT